ncbi:hypothetical protein [Modicisalibacter sp. 'Wilcox']|uniref:hypothetical protein n=1 Tax=Modicisalibacter sp. 'Wilcox' TaxID=2679914 RepID=UPI0013D36878|nr:hypothetical protein [Modicisalibacter sp. 'Wilcox']
MPQPADINDAIAVRTVLKALKPGLYVIRYIAAQGATEATPLGVGQAPLYPSGQLSITTPDGGTEGALQRPGDYLVLNVTGGNVVVAISKYAPKPLLDTAGVHWRIEPLAQASQQAPAPRLETAEAFSLTGHIERRGDVTVGNGEWLGNPEGRARLEGVQIDWPTRPATVDISGWCQVGEHRLNGQAGDYLGTRRRAAPIANIGFQLQGAETENYRLTGEAAYSDGTRLPLDGTRRPAAGAHLVALRLHLQHRVREAHREQPAPPQRSSWLDPEVTHITTDDTQEA